MAAQYFAPLLARRVEPLRDGARRHPECRGKILLFPAQRLVQCPGVSRLSFAQVEARVIGVHAASA